MKRRRRHIMPGHLRQVNHTATGYRYSGTGNRHRLGFIAMRIYGPNGTALAATPAPARRAAAGGFQVSEQESPRQSPAAGALRSISTLDALMALQGVEDPTER